MLLAVASGGFGALWRLLQNIPRLEIKPGVFVGLSAVRPVLVIGCGDSLVATGHGVGGVVGGTALGSAAAVVVAAFVTRRSYRLGLDREDAREIVGGSRAYVPIILAFWVLQNGDLFALSRFASDADVGLYRVANRVGSVALYGTSAFLTAWVPLRRTSAYARAAEEHGARLRGTLFTYFCIFGLGMLLVLTIGADLLVRIAPPAYADAAPLIPLIGVAFLASGLLVATNRSARFPRKRTKYLAAVVLSAACMLGLTPVLIPALDSYGAALSVIIGLGVGSTVMLVLSQRGSQPMELPGRQLMAGVLVTLACLGLAFGSEVLGDLELLGELSAILAFPLLLVATGAVPRDHARALVTIGRTSVGRRPAELDLSGLEPPLIASPSAPDPVSHRADPVTLEELLANELAFEEDVRYYLHDPPGAHPDWLIVAFSSSREGRPAGYSHAGALMSLGCAVLLRASNRWALCGAQSHVCRPRLGAAAARTGRRRPRGSSRAGDLLRHEPWRGRGRPSGSPMRVRPRGRRLSHRHDR